MWSNSPAIESEAELGMKIQLGERRNREGRLMWISLPSVNAPRDVFPVRTQVPYHRRAMEVIFYPKIDSVKGEENLKSIEVSTVMSRVADSLEWTDPKEDEPRVEVPTEGLLIP